MADFLDEIFFEGFPYKRELRLSLAFIAFLVVSNFCERLGNQLLRQVVFPDDLVHLSHVVAYLRLKTLDPKERVLTEELRAIVTAKG
jgi:hypothetical protein